MDAFSTAIPSRLPNASICAGATVVMSRQLETLVLARAARVKFQALLVVAVLLTLALMLATPWCAAGLVALPLAVRAAKPVRSGLGGKDLIPVLKSTGLTMLVWAIAVAAALFVG